MPLTSPLLKTQQVAEALGVSVSTIKRWVDSGVIRATRTVGKHRLISLKEAIRFAKAQNLLTDGLERLQPVEPSPPPSKTAVTPEMLFASLKRGRLADSRALIAEAYETHPAASNLADDLIRPVMEQIGHEWGIGALDVYQEHRATRAVEAALSSLVNSAAFASPGPDAPLALGATPEGDPYSLAGLLCELALKEAGWEVLNLGTNLPASSLAKATRVHHPRLVWMSVNHLPDIEKFVADYNEFHASAASVGAAVYLGGAALTGALRARLPATGFGERICHLSEFARRLAPEAVPPRRPPNQIDDERFTDEGRED